MWEGYYRYNNRGIACVFGGFLIHFTLGTIYTFGNMSPYIGSYLRKRTSNTEISSGHLVWVFSMAVFTQGAFMSLGGLLDKKIGSRFTCLIGAWMMSLGTILTYFTIKVHLWAVIITYGVLFGVGSGLVYSVALSAPMKWFPARKGLVAGAVVAGYGLGSLIFNIVQTKFINPMNNKPNSTGNGENFFNDPEMLDRIPMCFVVIGFCYAVLQLIGVILLMDHASNQSKEEVVKLDEDVETKLVEEDDDKEKVKLPTYTDGYEIEAENPIEPIATDMTVKEAIRDKRLYILCSTFFFNGFIIITISSLYKSFGQNFIKDDSFLAIVGAVAAIFNAGGRVVWGRLMDRFSYRIMMSILTVLSAVSMGTFYFCSFIPNELGAKIMFFIWVCLLFFCLAGNFALFPTATAQSFGNKNMAIIFGFLFAVYGVSSIIGATICSLALHIIHYWGQFIIATIAALISLVITQFFRDPKPRLTKLDDPQLE